MHDDALDYHVLIAAPRKELEAAAELRRMGLVAVAPTETKLKRKSRHAKTKIAVEYPLMPRYVVAGTARGTHGWRAADAIVGAVTFNGVPARLSAADVAAVIGMQATIDAHSTHRAFQAGGKARIGAGPLEGYTVDVGRIRGKFAWVRLAHAVMGVTEVKVTLDLLEAA